MVMTATVSFEDGSYETIHNVDGADREEDGTLHIYQNIQNVSNTNPDESRAVSIEREKGYREEEPVFDYAVIEKY